MDTVYPMKYNEARAQTPPEITFNRDRKKPYGSSTVPRRQAPSSDEDKFFADFAGKQCSQTSN
jgi:hypothetical protein